MQLFLAGIRRQFLLVFLVAALVPLAVFAAISFSAVSQALHRQQHEALVSRRQSLRAAFGTVGSAATDQIVSYGVWTPFCKAIAERRLGWIADNVTAGVPAQTSLKGVEVLTSDGRLLAAGGEFGGADLHRASVVRAALRGRVSWEFAAVGDHLYVLAAGPVVSQNTTDHRRYGVVVFGQPVDTALLSRLMSEIGARSLALYVNGGLVTGSGSPAPGRLDQATDPTAGGNAVDTTILVALRDGAGRPQAQMRIVLASDTLSLADSALWHAASWAFVAAVALAIGVGLGLTTVLRRPLQRLARAARAITAGEHPEPLEVRLRDELGELALAFNAMNEKIARQLAENAEAYARLDETYLETVTALAAAMEAKDHYTADHAASLVETVLAVGARLGLSKEALRELHYAAVLHDVGKIGVPGQILNKPGPLDDEEFAVMAEHTVIGERIVARVEHLRPVARIVRSAHERWDGKGYPDGLAGDAIPLASRILLVCDAYDAMTSDRPYREALAADAAREELRRCAGSQFDPAVVDAFLGETGTSSEDGARPKPESVSSGSLRRP